LGLRDRDRQRRVHARLDGLVGPELALLDGEELLELVLGVDLPHGVGFVQKERRVEELGLALPKHVLSEEEGDGLVDIGRVVEVVQVGNYRVVFEIAADVRGSVFEALGVALELRLAQTKQPNCSYFLILRYQIHHFLYV